ncbi:MAG: NAD(P)H-dependent glycerol-3-phosphate dehydrogenase [bacterium]
MVIGGGSWGTTLAKLFSPYYPLILGVRTCEQAIQIKRDRENRRYLPGIPLPPELEVEGLGEVSFLPNDILILAVPAHQLRATLHQLASQYLHQPVVIGTKGLEWTGGERLKTCSQVVSEVLPEAPLVVWGGPNISWEIAKGLPARAVLASEDPHLLSRVARRLTTPQLTFEFSRDVRGVELCSALKGLIAIALGLVDGLGLGVNCAALVLTYGLQELVTLADLLGISPATIYGIAGLGDSLASGLSPRGRNRTFGQLLAQGYSPRQAQQKVGMVVEGLFILLTLSQWDSLDLPLPLFSFLKTVVLPNGDGNSFLNLTSDESMPDSSVTPPQIRDRLIETILHYPRMSRRHILKVPQVV